MKKIGRLIETVEELKNNLRKVESYLSDSDDAVVEEMLGLIGRGRNFVAYKVAGSDDYHFAPSRFVGYLNNSLIIHSQNRYKDGKETSPRLDEIFGKRRNFVNSLEKHYLAYCSHIGAVPYDMRNAKRKYWVLSDFEIELFEGGVTQVTVNRYERNPEARRRCIEKYGTDCYVCGMNFKDVYGEIGDGFIHVHHIIPLSTQKESHIVDTENLIPVCPNCHAMLHKGNMSVRQLQTIIKRN